MDPYYKEAAGQGEVGVNYEVQRPVLYTVVICMHAHAYHLILLRSAARYFRTDTYQPAQAHGDEDYVDG